MNEKKQPQVGATATHISSSNQEITPVSRPQQKASVLRPSGSDTSVVAKRGSQDVNIQQFSFILYILIIIKSSWPKSESC